MKNVRMLGYTAAIVSTILLGSIGIFVRNVTASATVITFTRVGFGLVFLTLFIILTKGIKQLKLAKFSLPLLITGVLLALTSLCYINAINHTSLANAVFLLYIGPIIAVGMATILLKEKFTALSGGLLCLAFLGVLFILEFNISFNKTETTGLLWGIGAALCYALYIILNRNISEQIPALTRSFYQLLAGTLVIVPFLDGGLFSLTTQEIYWLAAMGFFQGFLAFSFIIFALKHLKAIEYGTISYVEPIVASLIGFAFYAEVLTPLQCVGCVIVFSGGIIQVVGANNK
ncbi:MAG: drug/metabolite transporter (DMT)-like permease [Lysobacterales bacterium]|jgi:drug/metabolite transporter (DMT)-like permease